jgi:hypothetical protein
MKTQKIKKDTINGILEKMSKTRAIGPKLETSIKLRHPVNEMPLPSASGPFKMGIEKKGEQLRKILKKKTNKARGAGIKTQLT